MSCSRKDMNDTLTEVVLAACVTPALMPDRLLMEHVLLVSVLHHTVGLEVKDFCVNGAGGFTKHALLFEEFKLIILLQEEAVFRVNALILSFNSWLRGLS